MDSLARQEKRKLQLQQPQNIQPPRDKRAALTTESRTLAVSKRGSSGQCIDTHRTQNMHSGNKNKTSRARRASRPKVKTGCNNCKGRRVKCDETRPQCNNCVRSGRECDGFPAYKRAGEVTIPIAPRPQPTTTPSASTSPSSSTSSLSPPTVKRVPARPTVQPARPTPPASPATTQAVVKLSPHIYQPTELAFDAQEGQYFQVFRTHTAGELSGFFDSEFWKRSVLQESHSEASIRHAVIALGALYKTLEKASESPPNSPNDESCGYDTATTHYNFALQQYSKAVTRLRESLQNNETGLHRTILISIVLFTCFQSFTGDHKSAITQIQHGLGLLEERRQDALHPFRHRKEAAVEDELVQIFTRLAVQAKSYDMAFHFPQPYVIRLTPQKEATSPASPSSPTDAASSVSEHSPPIPDIFTSLQAARSSLDSLCERIMCFQETLSSYYAGPNNILPASLRSSGIGFRTQLAQWSAAFEPLLQSRRHAGVTNTERAGINVLKMISLMSTVLFLMGYSSSEMDFDNHTPQFSDIVELAKEVVVDEELSLAQARCGSVATCRHVGSFQKRILNPAQHLLGLTTHPPGTYRDSDSYTHIKASFALDLGIVPPLFVVATKCRDRKLRRDAIKLLLSTPRREGMWDSILSGRVGQWIMEIEEEGMKPYALWGPAAVYIVGDEQRVMVKEISFDLQRREATLRCGTRGAREGEFDPRAKEEHINWW